jgi:hypothetical protein
MTIIASIMKIAAAIIGDKIAAKWVSAARLWWRTMTQDSLRKAVDEEYARLCNDWELLKQNRGPLRPPSE